MIRLRPIAVLLVFLALAALAFDPRSGATRERSTAGARAEVPAASVEPEPCADGGASDATARSAAAAFRADHWPSRCWRPYSSDSPFNRRLPDEPRLHPDSAAIVRRLTEAGPPEHIVAGTADTQDDWGHPTYYAERSDPVFAVRCIEDWGRCPIEGHRVRIPDRARAAGGGDAHMTVVDEKGEWEYDFWGVRTKQPGGGSITVRWGGRTRVGGDGLGSAATAAGFGNLAGIIRAEELAGGRIEHALFLVSRCSDGTAVYPAQGVGRSCSEIGEPNADAPPMGARLQLAMTDEQIVALDVPPWKRTVLRAMARYGMYLGDTGGASWGVHVESGSTYTSFGRRDRLVALARDLELPGWVAPSGAKHHVFELEEGVDWVRYLRVVDPCVSQGTC